MQSIIQRQKILFCKYAGICVVTLPKAYIRVHFWQRVSAVPKHRFCIIRAASVPLLKMLDVSIPPWTAVVLCSSEFALQTRSPKIYMDVYFGLCLRFISAKFLASAPPICKRRFRTVMDAATEHPQRVRTDTDVRGVSQQRV